MISASFRSDQGIDFSVRYRAVCDEHQAWIAEDFALQVELGEPEHVIQAVLTNRAWSTAGGPLQSIITIRPLTFIHGHYVGGLGITDQLDITTGDLQWAPTIAVRIDGDWQKIGGTGAFGFVWRCGA